MAEMDICSKILDDSYKRALAQLTKPFINNAKILRRVETVALCLKNRAGVRALLAGVLAKVHQPKFDIRKPYTDITGQTGDDSFSGRAYDERYIQNLTARPYHLPINTTTAYLTPGFRTKNIVLTPNAELEGRPAEMYKAVLQLFDDVQKNRVSAQNVMDETLRLLVLERDKRNLTLKNLLNDIKRTVDKLPLAAEDIVNLVEQHLACKLRPDCRCLSSLRHTRLSQNVLASEFFAFMLTTQPTSRQAPPAISRSRWSATTMSLPPTK
jgi:DNA adenine methylase